MLSRASLHINNQRIRQGKAPLKRVCSVRYQRLEAGQAPAPAPQHLPRTHAGTLPMCCSLRITQLAYDLPCTTPKQTRGGTHSCRILPQSCFKHCCVACMCIFSSYTSREHASCCTACMRAAAAWHEAAAQQPPAAAACCLSQVQGEAVLGGLSQVGGLFRTGPGRSRT